MKQERILYFDVLRALCAIQVIVIWHGLLYYYEDTILLKLLAPLTGGALACFTLISGLFNNTAGKEVISFYKSRLKRFYLPYVVAYVALLLIGFNSFQIKDTLFSLLGISCFLGGQPKTLWYIAMLMIFYVITPLLCATTKDGDRDVKKTIIRCSVFYLFFIIAFRFVPNFELGIIRYFPFYALGLCISPKKLTELVTKYRKTTVVFFMLFMILYMVLIEICISDFKTSLICCVGMVCLFLGAKFVCVCKPLANILYICSEASMFAYLFHRLFFYICIVLLKNYGGLVTTVCMLLFIFPLSYYLQRMYNMLVTKYEK